MKVKSSGGVELSTVLTKVTLGPRIPWNRSAYLARRFSLSVCLSGSHDGITTAIPGGRISVDLQSGERGSGASKQYQYYVLELLY